MTKHKKNEPRNFRTAEERQAETDAKLQEHKVAAGVPVAVVGTEIPAAGQAQQLPETTAAPPAPETTRSVKLPADFDLEASGYSVAQIVDAAKAGHQVNKAYCESLGDMSQVEWEDAPDWQRESAVQGVCYAIKNDFPSPEAMHENWMKVKIEGGWTYGLVKDADAKTHPCLVPYDQLPEAQRLKDDHFRNAIMAALGVDMSQEDRDELNRLAGEVLKQEPTAEAKAMASMLDCAAAMTGQWGAVDEVFDWPEIAMCLAEFYRAEPATSAAAGLMQLKLKLKLILLPDADPRRVELMLDLFKLAVTRMVEIGTEDAKAEVARQQAAFKPAHDRLEKGEGIYDRDPGRFEKSDLGKALDKQTT